MTAGSRVIIVDDDVLLREGLAGLLTQAGFEVVASAADASGLPELIETSVPDVLVIDIRMPPTHTTEGLVAAKTIRSAHPSIGIMVLSSYVEVDHAIDLLGSGPGIGYLLKHRVSAVEEFTSSLRRVADGGSVIDPSLVRELVLARRPHNPIERLTPREREVLSLMAEGKSNAGIGETLHLSEGTVEKHVHRILEKLDLPDDDRTTHRRVLAVIMFLDAPG
ncbi:response regulator [Agromyces aurantiacus]|uniref:Response regulator n=1 Tax=Agromyces aurantiacus TaxID=165814 RepID=A0ABV9R2A4_9MICO|nr:response regulator transcription factor [Agromyces aurantiacus]MBM7502787.1 serine/threonine-protein kinase PknK [Agromyces aurantiacus]